MTDRPLDSKEWQINHDFMEDSKHLDEALSCIVSRTSHQPRVRGGTRLKFDHHVTQFLSSDVGIDWLECGLSYQTVHSKVEELLIDTHEEDNPKDSFVAAFRGYLSTTLDAPKPKYTVVFPLNFLPYASPPDTFKKGIEIERISKDEWDDHRIEAEELNQIADFFSLHPNDFDEDTFTFWKTNVDARDVIVPPNIAYESIVHLLGQFEYSFHLRMLHPRDDPDGLPKHSWVDLRAPPVLLVSEDGEINYAHAIDRNHRRAETVHWDKNKRRERFESVPTLDSDSTYDGKLLDAFHSYHRGMAEPRTQSSCLYFWQGLERLATKDCERLNTEDVVERAELAYELMSDVDPIYPEVRHDLADKRNTLVHEGLSTVVTRRFQEYTKIRLDALITLYLKCRAEFTIKEMDDLLKYGVGDFKRKELLSKVSKIEFEFES